ncbi:hypothetical protein, partial [Oscillibacter sp.]|uniref:hypothetical protein n=1 Tax=Oscillibacter sp. TaxID=1945593 RepID=UPI0028ABE7AB
CPQYLAGNGPGRQVAPTQSGQSFDCPLCFFVFWVLVLFQETPINFLSLKNMGLNQDWARLLEIGGKAEHE